MQCTQRQAPLESYLEIIRHILSRIKVIANFDGKYYVIPLMILPTMTSLSISMAMVLASVVSKTVGWSDSSISERW